MQAPKEGQIFPVTVVAICGEYQDIWRRGRNRLKQHINHKRTGKCVEFRAAPQCSREKLELHRTSSG